MAAPGGVTPVLGRAGRAPCATGRGCFRVVVQTSHEPLGPFVSPARFNPVSTLLCLGGGLLVGHRDPARACPRRPHRTLVGTANRVCQAERNCPCNQGSTFRRTESESGKGMVSAPGLIPEEDGWTAACRGKKERGRCCPASRSPRCRGQRRPPREAGRPVPWAPGPVPGRCPVMVPKPTCPGAPTFRK